MELAGKLGSICWFSVDSLKRLKKIQISMAHCGRIDLGHGKKDVSSWQQLLFFLFG